MEESPSQITSLLTRWSAGDPDALNRLVPLVYAELKRLAKLHLHSKMSTVQPTALVSEVYLRLMGTSKIELQNRAHFFAVVGQLIRRIQVDHYRAHVAQKRGGDQLQVTLNPAVTGQELGNANLLDLDQALQELEKLNPRGAQLIDLRFFAGLSLEEAADVMETSSATLKRDWIVCRAWLKARLGPQAEGTSA